MWPCDRLPDISLTIAGTLFFVPSSDVLERED
jgi:hypothetical protein